VSAGRRNCRSTALRSVEKHFQERSSELQIPRLPPDFLSSLVGSANFMRLSLMKAAKRGHLWCRVVGNPGTLGMTKGGRRFHGWRAVAGQKAFFISLGGPQAHDHSGRDDKGYGGVSVQGGCWLRQLQTLHCAFLSPSFAAIPNAPMHHDGCYVQSLAFADPHHSCFGPRFALVATNFPQPLFGPLCRPRGTRNPTRPDLLLFLLFILWAPCFLKRGRPQSTPTTWF
jgi:hypothetical protein